MTAKEFEKHLKAKVLDKNLTEEEKTE